MINNDISIEDREWLYQFAKLHNIDNFNEAISKLIDVHKTWNKEYELLRIEKQYNKCERCGCLTKHKLE